MDNIKLLLILLSHVYTQQRSAELETFQLTCAMAMTIRYNNLSLSVVMSSLAW